MNAARRRVLEMLAEAPVDEWTRVTQCIQKRTLRALVEAGLAKYRPYGKPPSWAITASGREALENK